MLLFRQDQIRTTGKCNALLSVTPRIIHAASAFQKDICANLDQPPGIWTHGSPPRLLQLSTSILSEHSLARYGNTLFPSTRELSLLKTTSISLSSSLDLSSLNIPSNLIPLTVYMFEYLFEFSSSWKKENRWALLSWWRSHVTIVKRLEVS